MTLVKGGAFCPVTVWAMRSRTAGLDARTRILAVLGTPDGGAAFLSTAYDNRGRQRKAPVSRHYDDPADAHDRAVSEVDRLETVHGYTMLAQPRATRVKLSSSVVAVDGNLIISAADAIAYRLRRSLMRAGERV